MAKGLHGGSGYSLEPEQLFSPFDRTLEALRYRLFGRKRLMTVLASTLVYAAALLALGSRLGISTNYFVLVPVIAWAIGYGQIAGFVAGSLALPANLALYALMSHPEYSPASKPIAEISGVIVGTILGYLSDYHKKLDRERLLRKETEKELRQALRDREALFREVHHRVKNNLNLIKSIIGLQSRRSDNPDFREAAARLTGRIMSISFVHERLYRTAELSTVAIDDYLRDLVGAITMATNGPGTQATISLDLARHDLGMDSAVPLGLIVNELVTNALKHGRPETRPLRVDLSLTRSNNTTTLVVRDSGSGFSLLDKDGPLTIEVAAAMATDGFGMTLLNILSAQLGGTGSFQREDGWTVFRLSFMEA